MGAYCSSNLFRSKLKGGATCCGCWLNWSLFLASQFANRNNNGESNNRRAINHQADEWRWIGRWIAFNWLLINYDDGLIAGGVREVTNRFGQCTSTREFHTSEIHIHTHTHSRCSLGRRAVERPSRQWSTSWMQWRKYIKYIEFVSTQVFVWVFLYRLENSDQKGSDRKDRKDSEVGGGGDALSEVRALAGKLWRSTNDKRWSYYFEATSNR